MSIWRRFRKNRMGLVGGALVVVFALVALFAPLVATHSPVAQDLASSLEPPSREHWFGTDELGRDLFSRVVFGARLSMTIGLVVVLLVLVIVVVWLLFFLLFYRSLVG